MTEESKALCDVCSYEWAISHGRGLCDDCEDILHFPSLHESKMRTLRKELSYKRPWWMRTLRWLADL